MPATNVDARRDGKRSGTLELIAAHTYYSHGPLPRFRELRGRELTTGSRQINRGCSVQTVVY